MKLKNILNIGDKIGQLTLLSKSDKTINYKTLWNCLCDCGKKVTIRSDCLTRKIKTKSCGCLRGKNVKGKYLAKRLGWLVTANKIYVKRYSDGDLLIEDFISLSKLPCYYCGVKNSNRFNPYLKKDGTTRNDQKVSEKRIQETWWSYNGLDRLDSSLPHLKSNCIPCCKRCNRMKSNYTEKDFIEHCEKIIKYVKDR